jgi:hypothetical protein
MTKETKSIQSNTPPSQPSAEFSWNINDIAPSKLDSLNMLLLHKLRADRKENEKLTSSGGCDKLAKQGVRIIDHGKKTKMHPVRL